MQVGGGQHRWELYHQLHLIERIVKRLPTSNCLGIMSTGNPAAPGWHAMNAHLAWALPVLLQLVQCLHTLWTPQVCMPAANFPLPAVWLHLNKRMISWGFGRHLLYQRLGLEPLAGPAPVVPCTQCWARATGNECRGL